jgi:hypothetical protein
MLFVISDIVERTLSTNKNGHHVVVHVTAFGSLVCEKKIEMCLETTDEK